MKLDMKKGTIEIDYNSLSNKGKEILSHPKSIKGYKKVSEENLTVKETKKIEIIKKFNIKTYN